MSGLLAASECNVHKPAWIGIFRLEPLLKYRRVARHCLSPGCFPERGPCIQAVGVVALIANCHWQAHVAAKRCHRCSHLQSADNFQFPLDYPKAPHRGSKAALFTTLSIPRPLPKDSCVSMWMQKTIFGDLIVAALLAYPSDLPTEWDWEGA